MYWRPMRHGVRQCSLPGVVVLGFLPARITFTMKGSYHQCLMSCDHPYHLSKQTVQHDSSWKVCPWKQTEPPFLCVKKRRDSEMKTSSHSCTKNFGKFLEKAFFTSLLKIKNTLWNWELMNIETILKEMRCEKQHRMSATEAAETLKYRHLFLPKIEIPQEPFFSNLCGEVTNIPTKQRSSKEPFPRVSSDKYF